MMMKQPGDSSGTAVGPRGCVLALPSPSFLAGDKEEEEPVLGGGDQAIDGEEDEVSYDSDDNYYEEDGKSYASDASYEEEESDGEALCHIASWEATLALMRRLSSLCGFVIVLGGCACV